TTRALCQTEEQAYTSPGVELRVEFDHCDTVAARAALEQAVEDVRRQIIAAELWPRPRVEGEE
ncbi:MAG: hypothetical protein ABR616_17010, partial [Dermatophilaceae bacterium]